MKNLFLAIIALFVIGTGALADEPLPPTPQHYFNDYAGLVSSEKASQLDAKLFTFDKQTSTQIVVAVFPVLKQDVVLEDYCNRTAQAWGVGTKEHSNGVALFVFRKAESDGKTKIRIEVGYGLEGAIPDALASRIIQNEIIPHFKKAKAGKGSVEWDAGFEAGTNAIMLAAKGEYSKSLVGSSRIHPLFIIFIIVVLVVVIIVVLAIVQDSGSYSGGYYGGSSSSSSGSSSSGSSGGYSGGGGSFGGGGASGDC